jgi:hypothetical protein
VAEWQHTDTLSVSPQRRWVVTMHREHGGPVRVHVMASTIESVIDQVKGRRIACPPDLVDFSVAEEA